MTTIVETVTKGRVRGSGWFLCVCVYAGVVTATTSTLAIGDQRSNGVLRDTTQKPNAAVNPSSNYR